MITIRHNRMPTADKKPIKAPLKVEQITKKEELIPRLRIPDGSKGRILRDICERYEVQPYEVMGKRRTKIIVAARQEFICTLHFKYNYPASNIANLMEMDLTSVKHYLGMRKASPERFADLQKQYA